MLEPSTRERLRVHLIAEEGLVRHVYQDSEGWWTIGVGRLVDWRKGGGLSNVECLQLLDNDIDVRVSDVIERFPQFLTLDAVRQIVLMGMAFQLGVNGLAGFHHTLAAVWRKDYTAAADGMRDSRWARQTPKRAQRLALMMETGLFPSDETRFA